MARNNNYYSKPQEKKWVGKLIACVACAVVIAAGACVMAVGTTGFKDWSFSRWFPKTETVAPAPEASEGGALVTEGESHGIRLMSAMVPEEEYATYGIDARSVENVFDLSVTYTPADTTYKATTFTAAFKNPSSAWATGKNVTDYAKITSMGETTARLEIVKAFSEPIIITANSKRNSAIRATRNVEFVGGFSGDILSTTIDDIYTDVEYETTLAYGTLIPDYTNAITITFSFYEGYVTAMQEKGFNFNDVSYTFTPEDINNGACAINNIWAILTKAGGDSVNATNKNAYWQAISSVFLGNSTPEDLGEIEFCTYSTVVHRVYNGVNYGDRTMVDGDYIYLTDCSGFEVTATGLAMDTTPIIAG